MGRPEDIPEEVWAAAGEAMRASRRASPAGAIITIARAIMADRAGTIWQPIETAPQDGTPVLAILNTRWDDRIDQMNMDVIWFDVGGWHSGGVEPLSGRTGQYPVYWRSLPPPPEED